MDLTPAQWLAILGTGGIGYIVSAVIGAFKDRAELKNAKPRADVMALADSLNAQGQTVRTLATENERLSSRVRAQGETLESYSGRIDMLEKQIDGCEHLFRVSIAFINHLIAMWPSQTVPVPRTPPALLEHLNPLDPKEFTP